MSRAVYRISRMAFAAVITGLLFVLGAGCVSTGSQTAASGREGAVVEQAKCHYHTPWRYRHMRHRHAGPARKGQKPIFPCPQCDGPTKKVDDQ